MQGYFYTPPATRFYYAEAQQKKRIVLHFTAGNLAGDMNQLTIQDYHVSVPFVIARDGKIYQLFYSKYWSHHLGLKSGNPAKVYDRQSIGIEISNYGWLESRDGQLETAYSRQGSNPSDVYCGLGDTEAYLQLNRRYRDHEYYASFTPAQLESTIVLVRYLLALYSIPPSFLPPAERYEFIPSNMGFAGILSHVNYRDNGKWDIGPAFDWEGLIQGVQAESFVPVLNPLRSVRGKPSQQEKEFAPAQNRGSKYKPGSRTVIRQYNPFDWEE
ncbi:MAG TPA: peptidoglycan recognition family protein [Saprospiraceae bacterium]|nr:peptidoglycan recognition family protein [Saprospiraceae bacterium]HNT20505.1 peptidoglycan recognition family protein [Saprospiraceae bacterium]